MRVFAIEQFHHFAYMAIGVAMLGFGASGTLLALAGNVERAAAERWFPRVAVVAAATLVLCPAAAERLAVDPTQLAWNAGAWPRLAGVYLLLAVPVAAGALAILLVLSRHVDRPGGVYGASFVGSGLGAAAAVGVLWVLPPDHALATPALCAAVAAIVAARTVEWRLPARGLTWLTLVIALAAMATPPWRLEITPYKGLPQVEAYPEARRTASVSSPLGWVTAVDAPAFRYAPGLSLGFSGEFPRQLALFVDGHLAGAVADWDSDQAALALLEWLPAALPYALGARDRVLVIGAGGGTEVWTALAHGARHVTASELLPAIVTLTTEAAPRLADTAVHWKTGDARSFVSRTTQTFDLVSVGPTGGMGTGAAGLHALNEDFLHTVEGYTSYLELLSDRGVLAVSKWLTAPPRESVRAILTAAEALRRVAPDGAHHGLVVARSWGTVTLLAKPGGFDATELEALRTWATMRQLDLDWYPGLDAPAARFHILEEPVLFNAARAAVAGGSELQRFAATYPFDVAPATDARPYPHHFLRGRSLGTFLRTDQGSWLPFAEWGYIDAPHAAPRRDPYAGQRRTRGSHRVFRRDRAGLPRGRDSGDPAAEPPARPPGVRGRGRTRRFAHRLGNRQPLVGSARRRHGMDRCRRARRSAGDVRPGGALPGARAPAGPSRAQGGLGTARARARSGADGDAVPTRAQTAG